MTVPLFRSAASRRSYDGHLLIVFLPKKCGPGADHIQQLDDDGRHAAKMGRPVRALPTPGKIIDGNGSLKVLGIHLRGRRRKEDIHALLDGTSPHLV